jgi:predicted RNase H-like nuclease (RuvC/YqgF family)
MSESVLDRLFKLKVLALKAGFTEADYSTGTLFRVIEQFDTLTREDERKDMAKTLTAKNKTVTSLTKENKELKKKFDALMERHQDAHTHWQATVNKCVEYAAELQSVEILHMKMQGIIEYLEDKLERDEDEKDCEED